MRASKTGVFVSAIALIMSFPARGGEPFNAGMKEKLPDAEYSALVALYNSTSGTGWLDHTGWLDEDATSWYGVAVQGEQYDEDGNLISPGNVIWIALSSNHLAGSIPTELGVLGKLQFLYLNENNLTGAIPPELGNLTSLQQLYLSTNQLTGAIPAELGSMSSLQQMILYENQLSGSIPPELGNLTNLTDLSVHTNNLSGSIPPELGGLGICRTSH